jgi:hypothetical protein
MVITPMVVAARIRKYYRRFYNAGATEAGNAKSLQSLGLHSSHIFKKMLLNQVFIETTPGYYYVSSDNYNKFRLKRRTRALAIASVMILALMLFYVFLFNMADSPLVH